MNWLQSQAINLFLPVILGPLVFAIVQGLKAASGWVDNRPAWQKKVLVPAIAILVTAGTSIIGQPVSCDAAAASVADCLNQFSPDILKAILGSGVAFGMHYLKNRPVK